ncbi:hypothetical protein AB1N83_005297 [Pleurotus pulmonarius]
MSLVTDICLRLEHLIGRGLCPLTARERTQCPATEAQGLSRGSCKSANFLIAIARRRRLAKELSMLRGVWSSHNPEDRIPAKHHQVN